MTRKTLIFGLIVVALIALGGATWYVMSSSSSDSAVPDSNAGQTVTLTAWDRRMGSPKAPILMVEYAAPQCPHCAHFDQEFFPLLKKQFIDTGKVYYVLRVFPLGPADVAAEPVRVAYSAS